MVLHETLKQYAMSSDLSNNALLPAHTTHPHTPVAADHPKPPSQPSPLPAVASPSPSEHPMLSRPPADLPAVYQGMEDKFDRHGLDVVGACQAA